MPKAMWNNTLLAESEQTEVVEGNHYFPADSLRREHFQDSTRTPYAPGKARPVTTASWWMVRRIRTWRWYYFNAAKGLPASIAGRIPTPGKGVQVIP